MTPDDQAKTYVVETTERRRHVRFGGSDYPLRIGRLSARLMDWSASGIGVQVKESVEGFAPGDDVELGILSDQIFAVVICTGRIQRIDPASQIIGLELLAGGDAVIPLLIEMLG